ncbi:MAG: CinA family nicotinamide mononucleotide deamidase-related protein [Parachlamydiaceae bacterium]|nr:CinA family nicotinamide mononucleotide deamidase-related protein [Parachlamydiaceae bacterium]
MNIEVIAIGNEVVSGVTVNTNAAHISSELMRAGFRVNRHSALPDNKKILESGLKEALERNQLVIATGGLGPTCDDVTRQVAASLFHSGFHYDESIANELKQRYGSFIDATLKDQATVPDKALILRNKIGSAPGFVFKNEQVRLILLPGVPVEMRAMLEEAALPYIKQEFQNVSRHYSKVINLVGLPESAVDPLLRRIEIEYPHIECGIYPSLGYISVHFSTLASEEKEAQNLLDIPYKIILDKFKDNSFESPSGRLSHAIHERFIQNKWTLSVAESCSGGSLAAALTQIPGASQYFLGGLVVYSDKLKEHFLHVPKQLLLDIGAVSEEVVTAMIEGLLNETKSDFGIAITGIAGPTGGTEKKPVGTVWAAIGRKGLPPFVWQFHARGNREMILGRIVNIVLGQLWRLTN